MTTPTATTYAGCLRATVVLRALVATIAVVVLGAGLAASASGSEPVSIIRDSRGEPHVSGQSAPGTLYGFAYAQMQDQASYILTTLATATGRSAELTGPACLPLCFYSDQLVHLYRLPESSYEKYSSLPADTRARLRAFADGINAYIDANPSGVPAWAEHVTPQDVLASTEFRFVLAEATDADLGGPADTPIPSGDSSTFDGVAHMPGISFAFPASNAFVLAGSKTATGKPMLEGNPHLPFDGASRWYSAQLSYPGTSVEGATFRGLPGIAIGSNGNVAWSHTANHGNANESDRYMETLNPANPNQYLFGGAYQNMTVRQVPIKVQTSPGAFQTINVTFRYTVHGPVVSDPPASTGGSQAAPAAGTATSATISQFEQVGIATQLYAEAESHNLGEYLAALRQNQLSGFNIIAGDESSIFYSSGSRSGVLNPGLNPTQPLDGSNPYTAWQGILPFDSVPQASNPASGYYQNANNSPWYSAPGQIIKANVPYYLRTADTNGTRSRRQKDLLGPLTNATLADVEGIGNDNVLEVAPALKELLSQTAAAPGANPKVVQANALIQGWDNHMEKESTEYPLFATWTRGINEKVAFPAGYDVQNPPPLGTTYTNAQKVEASRAMTVAFDGMMAQYGTIAKRYGDIHTYTYGSVVNQGVNGGDTSLAALKMTNCKGETGSESPVYYHHCHARGGSGFMFNVNLANDRFTLQRPVSDTDNPASPFYSLNAVDFVNDAYRDFPVNPAAIAAQQTSRLDLTLPDRPSLAVENAGIAFGPKTIGGAETAAKTMTFRNAGATDVYVNSATLGGSTPSAFRVTADGCSARTLRAAQSCSMEIAFAPVSKGAKSATLTVSSDASPEQYAGTVSGRGASDAQLQIHPKRLVVDARGRFTVAVGCVVKAQHKCYGRVELLANSKLLSVQRSAKPKGHAKLRRIAKGGYAVAKGQRKVRSHLSGYGLRALRRHGHMKVRLVITVKRPHQHSRKAQRGVVLLLRHGR